VSKRARRPLQEAGIPGGGGGVADLVDTDSRDVPQA